MPTNPYKGLLSFRVEDEPLFFRSQGAADQLVHRVLANPLTLVHAPSASGKTSLLNAGIIPRLERRGWLAVRIRPGTTPLANATRAIADSIAPPCERELAVIERAARCFGGWETTIGAVRARAAIDPRRIRVLFGFEDPGCASAVEELRRAFDPARIRFFRLDEDVGERKEESAPAHVTRWFRGTIDTRRFASLLRSLYGIATPSTSALHSWTLRELHGALTEGRSGLTALRAAIQEERIIDAETPGALSRLTTNAFATIKYARKLHDVRLVLVFDQFEELFTRLRGRGVGTSRKTRAQRQAIEAKFLGELAELARDARMGAVSCRLLISMREEHIARLAPIRASVPELGTNVFQVPLLGREEAKAAMMLPALASQVRFGAPPGSDLVDRILEDLQPTPDVPIEPAHLQLVCEYLWDHRVDGTVRDAAYEQAGGVRGILGSFLDRAVDRFDDQRIDAIDILAQLVTEDDHRDVVDRKELVQADYRSAHERELVVDRLVDRALVRETNEGERRLLEITHEFLVERIAALRNHPSYRTFVAITRDLRRASERPDRAHVRLDRDEFVRAHTSPVRLVLDPSACVVLLRAAVLHGDHGEVEYWTKAVCRARETFTHQAPSSSEMVAADLLDRAVLRRIWSGDALDDTDRFLILRSSIDRAQGDDEREAFRTWVQQEFPHVDAR